MELIRLLTLIFHKLSTSQSLFTLGCDSSCWPSSEWSYPWSLNYSSFIPCPSEINSCDLIWFDLLLLNSYFMVVPSVRRLHCLIGSREKLTLGMHGEAAVFEILFSINRSLAGNAVDNLDEPNTKRSFRIVNPPFSSTNRKANKVGLEVNVFYWWSSLQTTKRTKHPPSTPLQCCFHPHQSQRRHSKWGHIEGGGQVARYILHQVPRPFYGRLPLVLLNRH